MLIQLAFAQKLIATDVFQVTLAAMLISMFIAPFLIERVARLGGEMARGDWAHKAKAIYDVATSAFGMEEHVILCGYGRTGEQIGQFLAAEKIPFLALDIDPQRSQARRPRRRQGGCSAAPIASRY